MLKLSFLVTRVEYVLKVEAWNVFLGSFCAATVFAWLLCLQNWSNFSIFRRTFSFAYQLCSFGKLSFFNRERATIENAKYPRESFINWLCCHIRLFRQKLSIGHDKENSLIDRQRNGIANKNIRLQRCLLYKKRSIKQWHEGEVMEFVEQLSSSCCLLITQTWWIQVTLLIYNLRGEISFYFPRKDPWNARISDFIKRSEARESLLNNLLLDDCS